MNEQEVSEWLKAMTDKQFAEFFYKSLSKRHLYAGEEHYLECHLVLAAVTRDLENNQWSPWKLVIICPVPNQKWVDDAPICQFGTHCGNITVSWAKHSECPVCGEKVFGT